MNITYVLLFISTAFGLALAFGLSAAKKEHSEAREESHDDEWNHLPINNLDRERFHLWRVLHVDQGVTPKRQVEDENRTERARWDGRNITSPIENLELFPQMIGSNFVGAVGGLTNDSLVIKSGNKIVAEAVPQIRTDFGGFDILMPDGPWLFEWLDRRLNILMLGGASGQISKDGSVIAVFAIDYKHPRAFKRVIAFDRSLTDEQKLLLLIPIVVGNYRGASFNWGPQAREKASESAPGIENAPTLKQEAPATLRQRFGPLLLLAFLFPPLFLLLFSDLIFMSAHDYIRPFHFVLLRVWPISICLGLVSGAVAFRSLRLAGRTTREAMTYFTALATIPLMSAALYITNSLGTSAAAIEVKGLVMPQKVPIENKNGRIIAYRTQVSFPQTEIDGREIDSFKLLTHAEESRLLETGAKEVVFQFHKGRLGMDWFE